jgi:hypothetical protein
VSSPACDGLPEGNTLDRGTGFTGPYYRDHANSVCGMEVVARDVPQARFSDGQSLPLPLTPEQIASGTMPNQRYLWRSSLGVPSLATWVSLGRTEQMPDAWQQNHVGLFAVIPRSAESVLQAQLVFGDTIRDFGVDTNISAITAASNWFQFTFLFSAGFSSGGAAVRPRPKARPEMPKSCARSSPKVPNTVGASTAPHPSSLLRYVIAIPRRDLVFASL